MQTSLMNSESKINLKQRQNTDEFPKLLLLLNGVVLMIPY